MGLKQPILGIAAAVLVIGVSLGICVSVSPGMLGSWITLIVVAMVPPQVVLSLALQSKHPASIEKLPQPMRGLAFVALTAIVGSAIAFCANAVIGGGITPPTPFATTYLIGVVPVVLFLVIPFQCWPFQALFHKKPLVKGVFVLAAALALTALFYYKLCNFGFLSQAPFYRTELDPNGPFIAIAPITFSFTMFVAIQFLLLLDFWPINKLPASMPLLGRQPWFGFVAIVFSVAVSVILWFLFLGVLKVNLVMYQVFSVSMIYGMFILIVLMEGVPSLARPQPGRGFMLIAFAFILAAAGFVLHKSIAASAFGLQTGPPGFDVELWISSAMMAVTFPLMVTFANYFQFYPFSKGPKG